MITLAAVGLGCGLDLLLGDPRALPHPVVAMGRTIQVAERGLRGLFPATPAGELWAGRVLALLLPLFCGGLGYALLHLCGLLRPWLRLAVESWLCYQMLAARELKRQSMAVCRELQRGDLAAARAAVSRIVGRDTAQLDEAGVAKAAVETVAENTSDGVIAPLFFLMLGGVPLGLVYKAINTLDSMVGYRNERYRHFGRAAAKLDDVVNYLPARLAALCLVLAAPLCGLSARGAWRIWRRDKRNHASPNSAQTEAACAGALGLQLAGPAWYFGKLTAKPTIGDATRAVAPADIARANRLMLAASGLALFVFAALRAALVLILRET